MKFRLASLDEKRSIEVKPQGLVIGRVKDCDVVLPEALMLSRRHCFVRVSGEEVLVEDLKSRNGCYVNNRRIEQSATLRVGDVLRIGGLRFRLEREETSEAASRPNRRSTKTAGKRDARKGTSPGQHGKPGGGSGMPEWFVEEVMDEIEADSDPGLEETDDFTMT